MTQRRCPDLIGTYMEYTKHSESPDNYHQWTCLSMIAACLRRQVYLDLGYFNVFGNMYVVLVGPPGKCRKTASINAGTRLVEELPDIKISADAITREALIRAIKESATMVGMGGTRIQQHSSLTIISKELSVFLGTGNHDLLSLLTDLYDCPNRWEYKTKNSGVDTISGVWLNLLGASTPTWLVGSIPITAIGGGFTSRVIFVVEQDVRQKVPIPFITDHERRLRDDIIHDLEMISCISGEFRLNKQALEIYTKWYEDHDDLKIRDPLFVGYSERKHVHLLKVAMNLAVSSCSDGIITPSHLRQALIMLDSIEGRMIKAFGHVGKSPMAADIGLVLETVEMADGQIERGDLLRILYKDIDIRNSELIISHLVSINKLTIRAHSTDSQKDKLILVKGQK